MTVALAVVMAGAALAHECVNASQMGNRPGAGAQVVFGEGDEPVSITNGLARRIEKGIVDAESGDGFHGKLGFDFDGDGVADGATWQVTPGGSIPSQAQENGPPCRGITNFDTYFAECVG